MYTCIWVKRYIMCAWPLHTAHMHAWACQCRYPKRACHSPDCIPRHDTPTTRCGRAGQDETTVHRQMHVAQNNHTTKVQCEVVCEYSARGMRESRIWLSLPRSCTYIHCDSCTITEYPKNFFWVLNSLIACQLMPAGAQGSSGHLAIVLLVTLLSWHTPHPSHKRPPMPPTPFSCVQKLNCNPDSRSQKTHVHAPDRDFRHTSHIQSTWQSNHRCCMRVACVALRTLATA